MVYNLIHSTTRIREDPAGY